MISLIDAPLGKQNDSKSGESPIEILDEEKSNNTSPQATSDVVDLESYEADLTKTPKSNEKSKKSNSNKKSKILNISYYKVGLSDMPKAKKQPSEDSNSKISETTDDNSDVIEIADGTAGSRKSPEMSLQIPAETDREIAVLESTEQEPQTPVDNDDTIEIFDSPSGKSVAGKRRKVVKKSKKRKAVLDNCQISFIDSSAEDSDVVEVTSDLDPLLHGGSPKVAEITIPEDEASGEEAVSSTSDIESSLKNIKVVSVCSLKDMELESTVVEVTPKIDLIEDEEDDESPTKKLKLDISINEIDAMSKTDLLNGNFVGTYGPYGSPWNGNYKCPLCEKYLCTSTKEFKAHIYEELQYGLYKCTACDYRDSFQTTVVKHHKELHKDIDTEERYIITPDQQIVEWVAKLIVFQTRILTLEKEESVEAYWYCNFCDYRCTNLSDMRKHQLRHWAVKPYTCTSCKYDAVHLPVMQKHVKRSHPGVEVKITESDIGNGVIIKRIRYSGRTEREDGTEMYEMFEMDGENELAPDVLLSCCYCNVRGTLDKLKSHVETNHPDLDFKVHRYRCNYCASTFLSPRTLDQHFISCHSGMKRSYSEVSDENKKYRCPHCSITDDKMVTIREHLRSHYNFIKCIHCDLEVVYWKTMRKHMHTEHPDKRFEFLYLLEVEKTYEKALSKIRETPTGHITISNKIFPNKKRKRTDDDNQILDDCAPVLLDEDSDKIEEGIPPKLRQVAKKSTGYHRKPKESDPNHHKTPDQDDLAKIITTVDFMGASLTMNIIKLSEMLNISPVVLVEDCGNDL